MIKQKKETKKLQKNSCCWYIATKLVLFFNAVYMYNTDCKHKSCYLQVIILIGIYIHKQLHIIIYLKIGTFIALEIVPLVVVGIKRLLNVIVLANHTAFLIARPTTVWADQKTTSPAVALSIKRTKCDAAYRTSKRILGLG